MLNRKLAPPFQKTLSITLPQPIEAILASGINIFGVHGIEQNVVKVEVIFSAGKWFESKIGLSHFTAALLEKGTHQKTADQIADTLDHYGASLEISPGFDFVSVSLYSLRTNLEHVFPLFLEILQDPSFPEAEWALMKEIFLQNLKISNEKTSYRAGVLIRRNIFGAIHPYGSTIEEPDVNFLALPDFTDFFKSAFKVHSIYWVGNLSDSEIGMLLQGFQSLRGASVFPDSGIHPAALAFAQRVEKEGSLQSSIRLGKRSLSKTDPEYFDLLIFNHLLGGFFGSRLMNNIREEKGLTYGIYSSLNTFAKDAVFMIGADVNKSNLELAISEIRIELKKLQENPVTASELALAKNHLTGSLQADMANLFSVIEKIKNIHLHDLPLSYYQDLFNRIDLVSPEEVLRIAGKYVREDTLFEVAVG